MYTTVVYTLVRSCHRCTGHREMTAAEKVKSHPTFPRRLAPCLHNTLPHARFSAHDQDDAPPYFTIFLVGHIVVPLMLWVEKDWMPDLWVHVLLWIPLSLILTFLFLPRIKGAVLGAMVHLGIH